MGLGKKKILSQGASGENFNSVLYTGNGSSQYISNVGFEPDLVWAKARNNTHPHILFDSVRGENRQISSNETSAEIVRASDAYLFDKNGFTVTTAGNSNNSGFNYVAWNWKGGGDDVLNEEGSTDSQVSANTAAGFSIVKYTGAGDVNVGHGLSATPNLIISKITNVGGSWVVYNSISGTGKYLVLNDTASIATASEVFSAVTDTTFTHNWSGNSYSYIAYCFHSVAGYSKIGSYTWSATSNTAGTMVTGLGFTPSFVMIKRINGAGNWNIYDNIRVSGTQSYVLWGDLSDAEYTNGYGGIIFDSDGFSAGVGADGNTTASAGLNQQGGQYLYMAFK